MVVGKVKWFDIRRGYGFIALPDGRDAFVRYSDVEGRGLPIQKGEVVTFEIIEEPKGPHAIKVKQAKPGEHITKEFPAVIEYPLPSLTKFTFDAFTRTTLLTMT